MKLHIYVSINKCRIILLFTSLYIIHTSLHKGVKFNHKVAMPFKILIKSKTSDYLKTHQLHKRIKICFAK